MLYHRKLDYVGQVVRSLRDYPVMELFEYIVMFSKPSNTKVGSEIRNATMQAREAGSIDFQIDQNGRILQKSGNKMLRVPAMGFFFHF